MSTRTIAAVVILIGILIAVNYDKKQAVAPIPNPPGVVCTDDAMECPDGSYVGRTGPNCEFVQCPVAKPKPVITATIKGLITTSPGCGGPQTLPPNGGCGPRPYQTTITFGGSSKIYTATSNASGQYSITLPPGSYKIKADGGQIFPACPESEVVTVVANQTVTKDITCDSGML